MSVSRPIDPDTSKAPRTLGLSAIISVVLPVVIFAAVLVVLFRLLHQYNYHAVLTEVRNTDRSAILLAFVLCAANYAVLAGYDGLALRYIGRDLAFSKIALTAFISYTISQNVGLSVVSGGAVRYRLYSRWGMSATEIAQVILFAGFHFWIGLFFLGGITCISRPDVFAGLLRISVWEAGALGIILVVPIAGYLVLSARGATVRIRGREFAMPKLRLAFSALCISSLDWLLAASVLYAVLPGRHAINYLQGLSTFLAAQMLGVLSHVPGGLGVFETVTVYILSPLYRGSAILGALLVFRLVYYIVPFLFGVLTLILFELRARRHVPAMVLEKLKPLQLVLSSTVPRLLAIAIFVAGALLLFSGALPTAHDRLWWVSDIVPLPILETSHFLNSVLGVLLLVLANGIRRRLRHAYILSLIFLFSGVVVSMVKGLDYEEATYLSITLLLLVMSKEYFRRATEFHWRLEPPQVLLVFGVLVAVSWLGLFAYKHQEYSNELWWQFASLADAPRFLRAIVVASVLFVGIGARSLMRVPAPPANLPGPDELALAANVAERSLDTNANLALIGDKCFLWSEGKQAFIMYRTSGRSWIALGDPVGPAEFHEELIWRFRELADDNEGYCAFYACSAENLPLYLDVGLSPIKLGEEGLVSLDQFSLEGPQAKNFRYVSGKFAREGFTMTVEPAEAVPRMLNELRAISDWWLADKGVKEKGFSLGYFDETYLCRFPMAVVRHGENILAFANLWLGADKQEVSIDLMRYAPDSPNGVMEFLFISLLQWSKQQGYRQFDLGMAPLSGIEARPLAPLWAKVGAYIYRHGDNFYNFEGLRRYKEKFHPHWEPRYLMVSSTVALPVVLTNVSTLIAGGLRGLI